MRVFVGSTSEMEDKALVAIHFLERQTQGYDIQFDYWREWFENSNVNGTYTWEVIERALSQKGVECAIMFWSGDDSAKIRERAYSITRDNVILETGAFLAAKGRQNVFLLLDSDKDIRLATDLLGLNVFQIDYQAPQMLNPSNKMMLIKVSDELKSIERAIRVSSRSSDEDYKKKVPSGDPSDLVDEGTAPEYKPRPRKMPTF